MSEMGLRPAEGLPPPAPPDVPLVVELAGTAWERRAVQVGMIAGKAVAIVRGVRRKWHQFDAQRAAGDATRRFRRETEVRSKDWRRVAKARGAELRDQTMAGYKRTRERAEQVGRDFPAQVVLAAAVTGFVVGIGLRVWRSNRGR